MITAYTLIFLTGVVAAFMGTIVGGGGLISIPLLTMLGLPPQVAIGTNKLGGIGMCLSGIYKYWKEKKINWRLAIILTVIGVPPSLLGTFILINVNKDLLSVIVGILVLLVAPVVLFQKQIQNRIEKEKTKKHTIIGHILYFLISIYSGFFGGGTGVFARLIYLFFYKVGIVEAGATDLVPGLFANIVSVIFMAVVGIVNYPAAIILFVGMLIGGYLGAHTSVKKGDEFVRILFVIFVIGVGIKLIFFG